MIIGVLTEKGYALCIIIQDQEPKQWGVLPSYHQQYCPKVLCVTHDTSYFMVKIGNINHDSGHIRELGERGYFYFSTTEEGLSNVDKQNPHFVEEFEMHYIESIALIKSARSY